MFRCRVARNSGICKRFELVYKKAEGRIRGIEVEGTAYFILRKLGYNYEQTSSIPKDTSTGYSAISGNKLISHMPCTSSLAD